MYALLLAYFLVQDVLPANFLSHKLRYPILSALLWMYMPYHLFFNNSNWFRNMQVLSTKLSGNYFYFPEHDNMMNWKILHGLDKHTHTFNLGTNTFKPSVIYYEQLDTLDFHAGWLIINRKFAKRSDLFLGQIDSLARVNYFSKAMDVGDVDAFFIDRLSQVSDVRKLASN